MNGGGNDIPDYNSGLMQGVIDSLGSSQDDLSLDSSEEEANALKQRVQQLEQKLQDMSEKAQKQFVISRAWQETMKEFADWVEEEHGVEVSDEKINERFFENEEKLKKELNQK